MISAIFWGRKARTAFRVYDQPSYQDGNMDQKDHKFLKFQLVLWSKDWKVSSIQKQEMSGNWHIMHIMVHHIMVTCILRRQEANESYYNPGFASTKTVLI